MKRIVIFLLPILFLGALLVSYFYSKKTEEIKSVKPKEEIKNVKEISLVLDFGNGKISTYSGIKVREKTVFAILKKVATEKNLELKVKDYSFGKLVEKIGDLQNNKEKAWIYFVNGKAGEVAADKMEINDGDVVEWRYIRPIF